MERKTKRYRQFMVDVKLRNEWLDLFNTLEAVCLTSVCYGHGSVIAHVTFQSNDWQKLNEIYRAVYGCGRIAVARFDEKTRPLAKGDYCIRIVPHTHLKNKKKWFKKLHRAIVGLHSHAQQKVL